jgi:hypothetical protein
MVKICSKRDGEFGVRDGDRNETHAGRDSVTAWGHALKGTIAASVVLCLPWPALAKSTCTEAAPRVTSAFMRRLARDTGNLIYDEGTNLSLVDTMSLGQPAGTAGALKVRDKAVRLWGHTDSKIHRKCTDAQAAVIYPGGGPTVNSTTDDLFNMYGLPWVAALRDLTAPSGRRCAQVAIVQAGYAARDQLRDGIDSWKKYGLLVDHFCPPGVFDTVKQTTADYLFPDLDRLRK